MRQNRQVPENRPVYRTTPRRPPARYQSEYGTGWAKIWEWLLMAGLALVFIAWPYWVWHSWWADGIWWGILAAAAAFIWVADRPAKIATRKARARMRVCAHCGRACGDRAAGDRVSGYAGITVGLNTLAVCHPNDATRPDCYRRITEYGEPVGALIGKGPLPAGIADLRIPPPPCTHPGKVSVDNRALGRVAWWCPDCETQLDPGSVASELTPDSTWPPIRKGEPR